MSLLNVDEAALYLRITPKAVHRLCKGQKLAYIRVDDRGTRRFRQEDLDAYISANCVPAHVPVDKSARKPISSPQRRVETAGQAGKGSLREEIRQLCQ
ncbi:MAG: helix-turn-helix domain-containing protein [Thermodesulfobacteriota bacterium]